jgi:hypothetical protein
MKKYLLLRKNCQTGPHSTAELSAMGLTAQDLLWIEGKSASWKHPGEIEELKSLVPGAVEKKFDRVPLQRTRLKNDNILFRTNNNDRVGNTTVLTENEVLEFPTLARFFMAEHYEEFKLQVKPESKKITAEKIVKPFKKTGVWVSLPSLVTDEKIVLISGTPKQKPAPEVHRIAVLTPDVPQFTESNAVSIEENNLNEELVGSDIEPTAVAVEFAPVNEFKAEIIELSSYTNFDELIKDVNSDIVKEEVAAEVYTPVIQMHQPRRIQSYSRILQKLAVAVAIGSLLTVAYLITDSILNPAYSLQPITANKKPVSAPAQNDVKPNQMVTLPAAAVSTPVAEKEQVESSSLKDDADQIKKSPVKKPAVSEQPLQEEILKEEAPSPELTEPLSAAPLPVEVIEPRIQLSDLVDIEMKGLKVGILGGIKEFDLVVKNNSDISIDQVVVELKYIQSNKKIFKTEMLEFNDIAAQSRQMVEVPKSVRGIKVESSIKSIAARDASVALSN